MNLNQITVSSFDLSKSISFYETLGLILVVSYSDNYARFECPEGDSTFSLNKTEQLSKENGTTVYFEIDNLDEHVESLIEKGIKFT